MVSLRLTEGGVERPFESGQSAVGPSYGGACAMPNTAVGIPPSQPSSTVSFTECQLCSELTSLVLFEPCGHVIVCEECCLRMKKCITCQLPIHRKVCKQLV